MEIPVHFYSYFKELAGCDRVALVLPDGSSLAVLHQMVVERFPRLAPLQQSTLLAVGVEYQDRHYPLRAGDVVSLFPPVQGG